MSVGIIIPVVLLAVVVPVVLMWAKSRLQHGADSSGVDDDALTASSARLTSSALRELPSPPWRVVYEVGDHKLGSIEHVLIGPAGVFALHTSMDSLPLPPPPADETDDAPNARAIANAAIARGKLDDALSRCAMSADQLVVVHWGVVDADRPPMVETAPGAVAVDGRRLDAWAESLHGARLSPSQVDLAWRTVVTAIGRPDPLA